MIPISAGSDRPGLCGRLRGALMGMLRGAAAGSICALALEVLYRSVFDAYFDQDAGTLLFWSFLLVGLGSGALLGAALGWRTASHRQVAVSACPTGNDAAARSVLMRLGWSVLGMATGGVLFGAAALGLGLLYYNIVPTVPDEGGSDYAMVLVVLPAGIVIGSICGAAAGWLGSAATS